MNEYSALITISIILLCFIVLVVSKKEPEIIFSAGLLLLLGFGVVSTQGAFSGLSNPGFISVACLYVIAAGIKESGLIRPMIGVMLNNSQNYYSAQAKIVFPVAFVSSFMNNTPIVAVLIPGISKWCKNTGWSKRLFLLPLSYAAILGGTCTLIGTSTNLLVYGFLQNAPVEVKLSFFEIGYVGIPLTIIGVAYLLIFSRRILGDNKVSEEQLENTREYTVEMLVSLDSSLVGKTIQQAQLRHLKGLYLVEIIRGSLLMPAIGPETILEGGDRLVFTGMINSISELMAIDGINVAENQVFKLGGDVTQANLVEAVVGVNHPLVYQTIKQGNFRKKYNAVIIAVLREGQRISSKIGDIRLKPGDTLLMLTRRSFVEQYRYSKDFLLVNQNEELSISTKNKRLVAAVITGFFVVTSAFNWLPVVEAAIAAALLMVVTGCVSLERAKQSLDLQVLMTIAAAFGIGAALNESGGSKLIAHSVLELSGNSPWALLVATYLMTMLLTELLTNNAAAVIAYSLVSGLVFALGYNIVPYAIAIMIAASASFISPLGYQTNLMVYSAGRYQFKDYFKLGLPLSILSAVMSLSIIPQVWNLQ